MALKFYPALNFSPGESGPYIIIIIIFSDSSTAYIFENEKLFLVSKRGLILSSIHYVLSV